MAICSLSTVPVLLTDGQHLLAWSFALAGPAGAASMDAVAHGTYCLCVGSDPDPLGGWGQLCCLLQDFREGQEIVEE